VVGGVAFIALIILALIFLLRRKKRRNQSPNNAVELSHISTIPPSISPKNYDIKYEELANMKVIGKGAFGVVYKAEWRLTTVAVKKLLNEISNEKEMEDFQAEVNLLKNLRPHPNVVTFLGITSSPISIVLEFCSGGSLYHLIHNKSKKISYELALKILKGVAAGMYHLHSENVIHRDLAARNILLTEEMTPKVSDFGLSRQKEHQEENVTKSETGPLKWMSPEALKDRKYSTKSDVWSFGVLVWEVTHRAEPYGNLNPTQAAMGVVYENLRLQIAPNAPPLLSQLMQGN
jgi:serine/threonine protein kinase